MTRLDEYVTTQFAEFRTFALRTIPRRFSWKEKTRKRRYNKENERPPNTRLCSLAAEVHLAGFAPAFTLSFHDSECSRKPPNAHSLGRYGL